MQIEPKHHDVQITLLYTEFDSFRHTARNDKAGLCGIYIWCDFYQGNITQNFIIVAVILF